MQQTFETWITPIMIGGLIIFMCFIIWDLAKKLNAGKFGTIMLFIVLGAGMLGYVIKVVITWLIEYASAILRRTKVGSDGKTPFERVKGHRSRRPLPEFFESVMYR